MRKIRIFRHAALILLMSFGLPHLAIAQSAFDDPGSRGASGVTGGDLQPVTNPITGDVSLGASSQIVVLFKNDDNKPVKTGALNLYPSSNISASIGENQCAAAPLQPGEICAISLQVKGLQQGSYRIEMLMRHEGRSKLLTATISGQVISSGDAATDLISDIETIPSSLDFGSLTESRSQVKSVVLRNITSQPIEVGEILVEAGAQSGFTVKENCGTLQTGQACVASVTWSPEQRGPSSGVLVVRHDGATGVATVELKGGYTPTDAIAATTFPQAVPGKGLLVSSEEDVDFGAGVEQISSITVSLVNTGDVPLTLSGIRMANTENGVRIEKRGCAPGTVLAPIEACPLTLTWEPVREGGIVDDIQITHSGARGVLVLPLRGTATRAVNKNSKAIVLGGDAYDRELIKNIKPLSVDDISSEDEVFGKLDPALSGGDDAKSHGGRTVDVRGALEGYTLTSFSSGRAIVSGPGGSRVVFNNERTVIGGVLWEVVMRQNAVEFKNGQQTVLLLFDNSLSSVNQNSSQSGSSGTSSSSASVVSTAPSQ